MGSAWVQLNVHSGSGAVIPLRARLPARPLSFRLAECELGFRLVHAPIIAIVDQTVERSRNASMVRAIEPSKNAKGALPGGAFRYALGLG